MPGAGFEPTCLSAAGFKPAASAIPPPRRTESLQRRVYEGELRGARAFGTEAIELDRVALQREPVQVRLLLDTCIQLEIAEFGEHAALPADQVMVVAAFGKLVSDRAVLKRDPTNEVKLLEQFDGTEDRSAPDIGKFAE